MKIPKFDPGKKDIKKLKNYLKNICDLAVKKGAADAIAIPCKRLPVIKVNRNKLMAESKQRSIHWPEPRYPNDSLINTLKSYRWAVLFKVKIDDLSNLQNTERKISSINSKVEPESAYKKLYHITTMLESACFYEGYHLTLGLASGNCKDVFCKSEDRCAALKRGQWCLHGCKSRPSIEACGIDPEELTSMVGWNKKEKVLPGIVFVD